MTATAAAPLHRVLGLEDVELEAIREKLGRDPNDLELAMFSVMWSEHCSYKSSRPLLATLPTTGRDVVAGVGEQAGVISIGDGLAVAFKIESHNHPSAVEPYQGAATGVGGILRDVFAMGARPIAVLDALRFGDPTDPRTRHLVDGVVRGVGGYGNCVGVPTVGGELVFDPSYQGNPLVNVMAIGLLEDGMLTRAAADGVGNLVVLYGSATGRDGIGGASVLASATFGDRRSVAAPKRPSVQVGDPFAEKLLIEATLELIAGGSWSGVQDLGAAGITCATSESADRAGTGMLIDLDAIPRREPGLEPFEVMISESQERMVAIVEPARWEAVREVCTRWDLPVAVIGRVTPERDIACHRAGSTPRAARDGARELARIPAAALTSGAIVLQRRRARRPAAAPPRPRAPRSSRVDGLPQRGMDPGAVLQALLGSPNLSSRRSVYEQYDINVQANTVAGPGQAPPCSGSRARRRRSSPRPTPTGRRRARPVARRGDVGRGGDPQRRDHRRAAARRHELPQLRRPDPARGLLAAQRGGPRPRRRLHRARPAGHRRQRLAVQRVARGAIAPTPEIGVVGLLDDVAKRSGPAFRDEGNAVLLVGEPGAGLGGSATRGSPAPRPRTGRPRWTWPASAPSRPSSGRRSTAASSRAPGRLGRRPRGGGRRDGDLGRRRGEPAADGGRLAGGRAVRREPVAAGVRSRRATCRRSSCSPASTASPATSSVFTGGPRLVIELAGEGATGAAEERGSRIADALDVAIDDLRHAWEHGLPRALGWEGSPDVRRRRRRPARSRPRGGALAATRRCSRSSTAARSRPASASPTAAT